MVDAGILSGDVAVVETSKQAISGDVVVAEIDGSYTIKEYRIDASSPILVARDQSNRRVRAKKTLNIIGVVRGVVRSYKPSLKAQAKLAT